MKDQFKNSERGYVVWLTGLPGAGKSTLAKGLYDIYQRRGLKVEYLDGDNLRALFPQIGFTKEARDEHIRRVGFMASLLERHGVIVIAAFVSPYRQARLQARRMCRKFIEVYVETSLEECERRDPKGLFKKARTGEIPHFTGISDPYEPPQKPEITIRTEGSSIEDSLRELIKQINTICDL
ncbi:MAG: adenylyl-sulfate kinase [Candidatus Omnitrophica bacterium]|nr:adenylyl-sulfate kinase [Candidatus Omnitrophota bacterium]MDE2223388.1 adenylyl-sulfate kinase [Candidatus Omnitrophota bacterium]